MIDLKAMELWVNPDTSARKEATKWRASNPARAAIMDTLGDVPTSQWVGDWYPWSSKMTAEVDKVLTSAAGKLVVFTLYNVPLRDLGNYSAGGAISENAYKIWVDQFAAGIKGRTCLVVVEPDALPMIAGMAADKQAERYRCIGYAVDKSTTAGGLCYIVAGNSRWIPAEAMIQRLESAGIRRARGFALNVSQFEKGSDEHAYAKILIETYPEARYVVDCGRNGRAPYRRQPGEDSDVSWCNPPGAGYGQRPTLKPSQAGCDGRLWIKGPVDSDGSREGAPKPGEPYPQNAVRMYYNANPAFTT